jgi:hypothetical protein
MFCIMYRLNQSNLCIRLFLILVDCEFEGQGQIETLDRVANGNLHTDMIALALASY